MALVYPFRGFRYNRRIVPDLTRVVTQPYDKISPELQEEYCRRSPYNAVRITLNPEKRKDPDTDYAGAGSAYREWMDGKVLRRDPSPSIYAYYQKYLFEGREKVQKGFIALLDLKGSASGIIPHERTLAAPKQDRLRLLRSIESNEDSVFMLYSDARLEVNRIMDDAVTGRTPDAEVADDYGVIHSLWAITDPGKLGGIRDAMQPQRLFIADGHHRFETSVNYMRECRRRGWVAEGVESFDKRMVTCFNIAGGVTILPTHRLIRDLPEFDATLFPDAVRDHFEVKELPGRESLLEQMKRERGNTAIGYYPERAQKFYLLKLKKEAGQDTLLSRHTEAYRRLDVSVLHVLLLDHYLGIDENKLVSQSHIDYKRNMDSCIELVDRGKYQCAFFLNPTTADQVQRLGLEGGRMPQKSTDFYPKLLTGLVFMKMNINKNVAG
ncbi:MAG: DUF1015 domain-containing protein [Acidobacteria bacterium]|nr:DUF1015 domain-containing protein [Acidobacteriota bacterium]